MSEEPSRTLFDSLPKGEDLGGLFTLHTNPDGSHRAEFGQFTAPIDRQLALKLDAQEFALAIALGMILATDGATVAELDKMVVDKLRVALRPDLETVATHPKPTARKKARRALLLRMESALDALENQTARKPHGSAAMLPYPVFSPFGPFREMPLAWVALETARQLVEVSQTLPTKADVQEAVEQRFPQAFAFAEGTWSTAFKDAGLSTLQERGKHETRPGIQMKRERARKQARDEREAKRSSHADKRSNQAQQSSAGKKPVTRRKPKP